MPAQGDGTDDVKQIPAQRPSSRNGRDVTDVSEQALAARDLAVAACEKALQTAAALNDALAAREAALTRAEQQLASREAALTAAESLLRQREAAPSADAASLEKRQRELARREATVAS